MDNEKLTQQYFTICTLCARQESCRTKLQTSDRIRPRVAIQNKQHRLSSRPGASGIFSKQPSHRCCSFMESHWRL